MRDFSKELKENERLKNSIEVAEIIRNKAILEMAKDVYAILDEIFTDGIQYVTYSDYYEFADNSEMGQRGITYFFFRNDSMGSYIKCNNVKIDYKNGNDKFLCYKGICINVKDDTLSVDKKSDGTSVSDSDLKCYFNELNKFLKVKKEDWIGLAEYAIGKKLDNERKRLEEKFAEVSCNIN